MQKTTLSITAAINIITEKGQGSNEILVYGIKVRQDQLVSGVLIPFISPQGSLISQCCIMPGQHKIQRLSV